MTRTGSFDFLDPVPSLTDILKERSDALTEQVLGDKAFLAGMSKVFSALAKPRPEEPEHERPCPLALDEGHYQPSVGPDANGRPSIIEPECTCNPDEWEAIY